MAVRPNSSNDTIFALSSGSLPAGVAVVRVSGPDAFRCFSMFHVKQPPARNAQLSLLRDDSGRILDQALLLWFPSPHSFTGEDVLEMQLHGSPALLDILFDRLGSEPGWRMADAGEFTRRAFINGQLDMTEVEGLGDLLQAHTYAQHAQAINQYSGVMSSLYGSWRDTLLKLRAAVEADFDFADEEDVSGSVAHDISERSNKLAKDIRSYLNDGRRGEIVREGIKVVLAGRPNVGKSSLMNALAQRDVAIVTDTPGTTRDVLTVSLNLSGQMVHLSDTAGLRDSDDDVEQEGIKRAALAINAADLVLWMDDSRFATGTKENDSSNSALISILEGVDASRLIKVHSKADLVGPDRVLDVAAGSVLLSVKSGTGLKCLLERISRFGTGLTNEISGDAEPDRTNGFEGAVITRQRHRLALQDCVRELEAASDNSLPLEFRVEYLRRASDALAVILGAIGVEDILGQIFSDFCIGK